MAILSSKACAGSDSRKTFHIKTGGTRTIALSNTCRQCEVNANLFSRTDKSFRSAAKIFRTAERSFIVNTELVTNTSV
jgi:hypothetical protein